MYIRDAIGLTAACSLLIATAAFAAASGDAEAGRRKAAMCQGCHGIPGYRTAFPTVYHVPKLGGQHAGYLVKALQAYKSGERHNATMQAIAKSLSDKDMADLAAYYAAADTKTTGK